MNSSTIPTTGPGTGRPSLRTSSSPRSRLARSTRDLLDIAGRLRDTVEVLRCHHATLCRTLDTAAALKG